MKNTAMEEKIKAALQEVYDPELPVNIYDLGLIYDILWQEKEKRVVITMTLTTPSCPAAELIPANIKEALLAIPKVAEVEVVLTFDPPYTPERMSEEAKLILGWTSNG